eukprot:13118556-Ditylum_brightwellii.AAC.1
MKQYGSLKHIWEISFKGKGILAELKPLDDDQRTNWHLNAGWKHHLKKIIESYNGQDMLDQNVYISTVHDLHHGYFPILDNSHQVSLEVGAFQTTYFQMHYFNWILESTSTSYEHDELAIDHYGVLLPLQKHIDGGDNKAVLHYYTFLTSEYNDILRGGKIGKSQLLHEEESVDDNVIMSESSENVESVECPEDQNKFDPWCRGELLLLEKNPGSTQSMNLNIVMISETSKSLHFCDMSSEWDKMFLVYLPKETPSFTQNFAPIPNKKRSPDD